MIQQKFTDKSQVLVMICRTMAFHRYLSTYIHMFTCDVMALCPNDLSCDLVIGNIEKGFILKFFCQDSQSGEMLFLTITIVVVD